MSAKTWPVTALLILTSGPRAGATIIPESPSPVVQSLRAVATGRAKASDLAQEIERCWTYRESRFPGCTQRLEEVLGEFSSTGSVGQTVVAEAIDLAMRGEVGRSKWAAELGNLRLRVTSERAQPHPAVPAADVRSYARDAAGKGPPSESEMGHMSLREFDGRLLAYVDTFLPTKDRNARIAEALEGSDLAELRGAFRGRALETCRDLTLTRLRLASLRLAMMELQVSRGNPEVLRAFLDLDRGRLDAILEAAELSLDESLIMSATLLRRWVAKRPSRWEAWADIEEIFGAR